MNNQGIWAYKKLPIKRFYFAIILVMQLQLVGQSYLVKELYRLFKAKKLFAFGYLQNFIAKKLSKVRNINRNEIKNKWKISRI